VVTYYTRHLTRPHPERAKTRSSSRGLESYSTHHPERAVTPAQPWSLFDPLHMQATGTPDRLLNPWTAPCPGDRFLCPLDVC
jgi:hypothetical protein